jgi:hypothetical protein
MWPWSPGAGSLQEQLVLSSDEFHARLAIKKGLIPIVNLAGAITYDRRGLAQAVNVAQTVPGGKFQLFDSNTSFGGEVDIPVPKTPNLDLAVLFQTMPVLNADGSIDYSQPGADPKLGIPALKPSISIETRFHF